MPRAPFMHCSSPLTSHGLCGAWRGRACGAAAEDTASWVESSHKSWICLGLVLLGGWSDG